MGRLRRLLQPIDWAHALGELILLIVDRLTVLRRSVLPRYQKAIADMDHLIQALDQELAQRQ